MSETEAVERVVLEARQHARADSQLDEQEWFEAGEDDTDVEVPLQDVTATGMIAAPPAAWERYAVVAGAIAIAALGIVIGLSLA